jgi:MFS family permease
MQTRQPQTPSSTDAGSGYILRSLRHRNYRLFFGGQTISLIGTWMQQIALSWLVYRLTNSAFLLGLVGFTGQIPIFFIAPFAGVFADRWNLHRTLMITQTFAMIQALLLATLVLTQSIAVWQIVALSLALGLINAIDIPCRQSFMIQMVDDKRDLSNAIALNSSMVNGARLIGPSFAGLLIAAVGEGICFLFNGISYIAVIIALGAMRIAKRPFVKDHPAVMAGFKEGINYAFHNKPIRSVLLLMATVSLIGMPFPSLMPILARDILHGGPRTLGFLMGATGVGALTGAVYLASRRNVVGLVNLLAVASGLLGCGLILLSFSRIFWVSLACMFVTGMGMIVQVSASNALLQTIVDDDKRGRVVSLFVVSFMGMMPFGTLLAGSVASAIGAPMTFAIDGALCLLASAVFVLHLPTWRKHVHPIYIKKGILTDPAVVAATDPS